MVIETQLSPTAPLEKARFMLGRDARATIEGSNITGRIIALATFADKPLHACILPQDAKEGIWVAQFEIIESFPQVVESPPSSLPLPSTC